jgi:hypothetical protein
MELICFRTVRASEDFMVERGQPAAEEREPL